MKWKKGSTGPLIFFLGWLLAIFSSFSFSFSEQECLLCHGDPQFTNEKGESVYVDKEKFLNSVHGQAGFSCTNCHSELKEYEDFPHPPELKPVQCGQCHSKSLEEFNKSVHAQPSTSQIKVTCSDCHGKHDLKPVENYESSVFPLNLPQTCEKCHLNKVVTERGSEFIQQYTQSVHFRALEKAGLTLSATCSDCHASHKIKPIHNPDSLVSRRNIIQTCGTCHVGIRRDYLEGVHGKAYTEGEEEVPVCTDCHHEHYIQPPQSKESKVYATKVAGVCSRCHENESLARQYGFLTQKVKTYFESYHGIASKFGETKVANCASCHGFHDIRSSNDPQSSVHPDNLAETCGKCHPGAGQNFAQGKIHQVSSEKGQNLSYFVKLFYIILIAVIIFVFILFIGADLLRRAISRKNK